VIPDLLKRNKVSSFDGMNPSSHSLELSLGYDAGRGDSCAVTRGEVEVRVGVEEMCGSVSMSEDGDDGH
jgi:hypothetical protein